MKNLSRGTFVTAVAVFIALVAIYFYGQHMHVSLLPRAEEIHLNAANVDVPLVLTAKNLPTVEVMINRKGPYTMVFDSGAAGSVIGASLAEELQLPIVGEAHAGAPNTPSIQGKLVRIDNVAFSGVTIDNLSAVAVDMSRLWNDGQGPRGVLTANLPGLLVTFDYPNQRMRIRKGALELKSSFSCASRDGLPCVALQVAGKEMRAHIDTGSTRSISLPRKLADELPLEAAPVQSGTARVTGGQIDIYKARLKGTVRVGEHDLGPDVLFSDLPAQLGFETLKQFAVTIDAANQRVALEKPADR